MIGQQKGRGCKGRIDGATKVGAAKGCRDRLVEGQRLQLTEQIALRL